MQLIQETNIMEDIKKMVDWLNLEFIPNENKRDENYIITLSDTIILDKIGVWSHGIGKNTLRRLIEKCDELELVFIVTRGIDNKIQIQIS